METARLLHGLDAEQRAAVTSTAMPLAIIAAAGSGKTTVLTRRIAHRIASGSAEPKHVVALTFTRDAAAELKRRLRRLDLRESIEAGTFHGVALRLLRDRAFTRHESIPNIAPDRARLLRECLTELRIDVAPFLAQLDVDWARARLVTGDRYAAACREERRRSNVPPARFVELMAAYERIKRRRGVIDFDDVLDHVVRAMRTDATFAAVVRWRFRHLFVDEAQDLNPLQHAVLEAWRNGRPDICLVGDPRQAIYGWNGADHTTLSEVERRYPGVTVIALSTNYRCTPQIVRAGAAALAAGGQHDTTVSDQTDGPTIRVAPYPTDSDEAVGVARAVRTALNHRRGADIAVLARTNEQLVELQRRLQANGVPTERTRGRTPLDLALGEVHRITSREALADWAEASFATADPVRRRVAEEIDRYLTADEPGGLRSWIEGRSPFDDLDQPGGEDAVAVLTFHAAKGREWPVVFVTGVEEGLVPHRSATTAAQRAEEARLLYVALTRAARELTITYALRRREATTTPSPWLAHLEATTAPDAPARPPAAAARPVTVDPLADLRAWRARVARAAGVADTAVCSDRVLRSLRDDPPRTSAEVAARLGISVSAAERLVDRSGPNGVLGVDQPVSSTITGA